MAGELGQPPAHRVADALRDAQARAEALPRTGAPLPTPSSPGTGLRRRRRESKRRSSPLPRAQTGGRAGGARRPPFPAAAGEDPMRGWRLRAEGDGEQDRLAGVAGQALHQGHRTGVRPVQVLQATTSPSAPGGARVAAPLPLTACKSKPRPRRPAGPPATAPGSRTVRCGSHGASEGSPGSGRLRSSCSKASVTGRYGPLADRQRSGKGRLQRLDLRPPPHQDRPQHLAHDPSFPHRRQGRSMITRPTPAGPIPSALSLIAALTAQNARIWTAVLMIGAEWASVQIGGSRLSWDRGASPTRPVGPLVAVDSVRRPMAAGQRCSSRRRYRAAPAT